MQVRQAIDKAKGWILDVYSDEELIHLGLEEVSKDYDKDLWLITVGFSRPWDANGGEIRQDENDRTFPRSFKVVTVDDKSGEVLSIKNRD